MIRFTIPVRVTNPLNGSQGRTRGGMIKRAVERRDARIAARLCMVAELHSRGMGPLLLFKYHKGDVTLTRVAPRPLDGDGWQAGAKPLRDGIAEALGVSDGPSGPVVWKYAQRRGAARQHFVEVEIA